MRMIRRTGWGQPRGIRSGVLWLGLLAWLLVSAAVPAAERVTYLHTDVLGSVVAASDANGQLLWREQYEPYGERIRRENGDAQGQWYTGHLQDADVGLDYMGSRWYDPTLGRFMAIDPVDIAAADVNRFNRYAYANNNPYLYADPDGELPIIAVGLFALDFYSAYKEGGSVGDATGIAALGIINPFKKIKAVSSMVSGAGKLGKATKSGKNFDQARREAFENAGMTDPSKVKFSKVDEATGTVVEFKGPGGAKIGYDGPHKSPGPHHDAQHISWQSAGKRVPGGAERGNIPYDGPRHPSRPDRKDQ